MYADEIWISIDVNGPQPEIGRLRKLCAIIDVDGRTDDIVVDFSALMPDSVLGGPYWTWNAVRRGPHKPGKLDFGFDISGWCPEEIFECLAAQFPTLAFYCHCIGSMDEFMASGRYNGPPGSSKFEYSDVPQDYWGACASQDWNDDES